MLAGDRVLVASWQLCCGINMPTNAKLISSCYFVRLLHSLHLAVSPQDSYTVVVLHWMLLQCWSVLTVG